MSEAVETQCQSSVEDRDALLASMERIRVLFEGMLEHASVQTTFRCPYRDGLNRCTAKFGCRNKRRIRGEPVMCGGDDKIDYRSAWESESAIQ